MQKDIGPIGGEPISYARVTLPVRWGPEAHVDLHVDIPVPDAVSREVAEVQVAAMAQQIFERDFGKFLTVAEIRNASADMRIEWGVHHAIA